MFPFCLAAAANFAHNEKVLSPSFVKGIGFGLKREGEASFPFLCFWFLLCHYKRNVSSFPLEKEPFLSCFPKQEKTVGTSPQRRKMIRCFKGTPKVRFRTVLRSVGQSRIPGFAIASTWCRLASVPGLQVYCAAGFYYGDPPYSKVVQTLESFTVVFHLRNTRGAFACGKRQGEERIQSPP